MKLSRGKRIFACIAFILIAISAGNELWRNITAEKYSQNKYGIKGEIIAEIPNDDLVDVIGRRGTDTFCYTFKLAKQDRYKEVFHYNSEHDYDFDYQELSWDTENEFLTLEESLHLEILSTSGYYI